jgi:hypothetical protein
MGEAKEAGVVADVDGGGERQPRQSRKVKDMSSMLDGGGGRRGGSEGGQRPRRSGGFF